MTIDEFCAEIVKAGISWYLDGDLRIRTLDLTDSTIYPHCPICAIGTILGKNPHNASLAFADVYCRIGLSHVDCCTIVAAADRRFASGLHGLGEARRKLLKACGLTKPLSGDTP